MPDSTQRQPDAPRLNPTAQRRAAKSPPITLGRRHIQIAQEGGALVNSPEQETFIENPIMAGAAIDYKATSIKLADQLWEANNNIAQRYEEIQGLSKAYAHLQDRLSNISREQTKTNTIIHSAQNHWAFFLLPRAFRAHFSKP